MEWIKEIEKINNTYDLFQEEGILGSTKIKYNVEIDGSQVRIIEYPRVFNCLAIINEPNAEKGCESEDLEFNLKNAINGFWEFRNKRFGDKSYPKRFS